MIRSLSPSGAQALTPRIVTQLRTGISSLKPTRRSWVAAFLLGMAFLGMDGRAQAQTSYFWEAPIGGNGVWDNSPNAWSTAAAGPANAAWPGAIGVANFSSFAGTVQLGTNLSAAGLVFGPTIGSSGYTLNATSAQVLTLGNIGITVGAGTMATTVGDSNMSLTLGAAQSWTNASAGALNINGAVTNGGNLLTISATSGGSINLTGVVSGIGGITVNSSSSGITTLSGNNTYTGTTTLTAGVLRATTNATALGGGSLQLNGGILQLADNTGLAFNRNTTVGGAVVILSDRTTAGAGTTQTLGTLSISAQTLTLGSGAFVTSGTAGITFGAATMTGAATFNTNNSLFATGVLSQTTLASLTGTFNATIGGSGNTTITGNVTTTTGTLTKNGTGTLTLNGTANTNTGVMTINGGSLAMASGATFTGAPALTFGAANTGGGSFLFNAAATAANQNFGALSFLGGNGVVQSEYGAATGNASLTFASLAARTAGASGLFIASGGTNGSTNKIVLTGVTPGANGIVLGGGAAGVAGTTAGAVYFFNTVNPPTAATPSDYAVYDTAGFVRALNYATDTTLSTTVAASGVLTGSLVNQITATSGTTGTVTQAAAATVTGLKFAAGTTTLATTTFAVTTPSILVSGGGTATISGTTGGVTSGTIDMVIRTDTASDALTIGGVLAGVSMTKTGAGTLTVNGTANTFTGNIYVNGGTYAFGGNYNNATTTTSGFGAASAAGTIRQVFLNGGTLKNVGGNQYNPTSNTVANAQALVVGQAGGTYDMNGLGLVLDDGGQLSGTGNFTLTNSSATAAVFLTGTQTYALSGNLFVDPNTTGAITLRVLGANSLGSTGNAVVMANNKSALDLQIAINNNLFIGGTGIAGAGAIVSSATGGGTTASATTTLTADILVNNTNGVTLSGVVTDAGRGFKITKTGGGFFTLNGANTYSGGTVIASGSQLALGNNSALGTGSLTVNAALTGVNIVASTNLLMINSVILNSDTSFGLAGNVNVGSMTFGSLDLGGSTRTITVPITGMTTTFNGPVTNGTGLTVASAGTLVLPGAGSFTGPVVVNQGGTLSVGATTLNSAGSISIGTTVPSSLNFNADGFGAGVSLASGTNVTLGGASSNAQLGLQLGSTSAYDSLNLTGSGALTVGANGATIVATPLQGFGAGTYTLISAPTINGFSNITLNAAALPTGFTYNFTTSATAVALNVTAATGTNYYWTPAVGGGNLSWNGSSGSTFNWAKDDPSGATNSNSTPGASQTVNFSATNAGAGPVVTTLDQNFSILGLVFLNSGTGTATINRGTFGTLTLGSGGITVATGAPSAATINAPVALGAAQTWTVTDAGQTLSVHGASPANGIISGASGITLAGLGQVTLGGFNTFSGGLTTSATGILNINNGGSTTTNSALGTGTLTITGGTIDNTSGVAQSILTVTPQIWSADFTFAGTQSLNMGTGAVSPTTNANRQITVTAGTLQEGGIISGGTMRLTKAGGGTLTLNGANTFTGGVTLNAGTLNVGNASALGTVAGTFIVNGGTLNNISGVGITTVSYPMTLAGDFTYGGGAALNLGTGATAITTSDRTITVNGPGLGINTNVLTIGGIVSGAFNVTKTGPGALALTGANTFGGAGKTFSLLGGTLVFQNNTSNIGNASTAFLINGPNVALDAAAATTPGSANPFTVSSDFAFIGTAGLNFSTAPVALGSTNRTITLMSTTNILSFGGVLSDSGGGLTANGTGILAFYGVNTYTGPTTINPGSTLQLGSNNGGGNGAGSLSASTTLTLNGGVFQYMRTGTVSQTLAGMTVGPGRSVILNSTATQTLNLGLVTRTVAGGTVEFRPFAGSNINTSSANNLGILGGWAVINQGASWAVGNGGAVVLPLATFTTTSTAGTTAGSYTDANIDVDSSAGLIGGTISPNSVRFNSATGFTMTLAAGTNVIGSGGILVTPTAAAGVSTITGGAITGSPGTAGDLILNHWGTTGVLNINSAIVDNPTLGSTTSLTKSGTNGAAGNGVAVIGGAAGTAIAGTIVNTFTGNIFVDAGTLQVNSTSVSGGNGATGALNSRPIFLNGSSTTTQLSLKFDDATGDGTLQNIAAGNAVTVNGTVAILVDRLGAGSPIGSTTFATPVNKTIQLGTLSFATAGRTLTVTPANGYGLEFTGTTTIDQNLTTINVGVATASNVVQGLTFSGQVTGTPGSGLWTKAGAGTLVLNNATNNFTSNIVLSAGVLAFNSDAALGNSANTITFTGTTAATALRAFGGTTASPLSIATARTINLWGATTANNVIEVAANTTLTLNAPFGSTNGPLTKSDLGTLVLAADNGIWSGQLSVAVGAVQVTNAGALGISTSATTGNTVVAATGAALQLSGVSIFEQLTLNGSGINSGGALQAIGGSTSTTNGLITLASAALLGADAGSTLNIRGGITGAFGVTFAGAGSINVDTSALSNLVTTITKINGGTTTFTSASPTFVGTITVNAGTLAVGGPAGGFGGAGTIALNPGGTLSLDDSVGLPVANRLSLSGVSRPLTSFGGTFNYTGNASFDSTETLGTLSISRGQTVITATAGANARTRLTFGIPTRAANAGATALIRGSNLGSAPGNGVASVASLINGFTFTGAGTAGQVNKGIIPWILVDSSASGTGTSFATADTATGNLRPLAAGEFATSLVAVTGANVVLGGTNTVNGSFTANSLTLNSGGGLSINPMQTFTVGGGTNTGGFLAQAGNTGISGGLLTNGVTTSATNDDMVFHVNGNLTVNSVVIGTTTNSNPILTKTGAGDMTLGKANPYIGQTVINQGKLILAGGNNTIFYSSGASYLEVGFGGTLDLNGNSQQVFGLFTDGVVANSGGTITGAAGSTLVTNSDGRNWAGVITGSVAFQRGGSASATVVYSNNDYTGATLISGGTLTLVDAGRLSGTASIGIDYGGGLTIDNSAGTAVNTDRIRDAAPLTFRGGTLVYTGRAQSLNTERFGALTLAQGASQFTMNAGTGTTTNEVVFTSFSRNGDATLNMNNVGGQIGSGNRLYFTGAETMLVNNILPWAVNGGQEFMSYNPTLGMAAITAAGYAGYDGTTIPAVTQPTQNIRITATAVVANSMGLNSLSLAGGATINLTFGAAGATSEILNLTSGGLLKPSGQAVVIGEVVDDGQLTAGGTPNGSLDRLFISSHSQTMTINSRIVDNGSDAVRLIFTGYNAATLSLTNGANNYSGGTVVNGWVGNQPNTNVLSLNGGVGQVVIPAGGLTINSGTVTMVTNGGQINSANVVTLNGPSTLTLVGANTLAGLVFNVDGGIQTGPTVAVGTTGLTLTGGITAGGSNPNALASISGTALNLNGNNSFSVAVDPFTFNGQNVAPLSPVLSIAAPISNGGIVKTGLGLLSLGAASTFAGGVDVQAGGLIFAASTTGTVTNGPVGTGTLLVSGNNTTLTADATARSIANAVTLDNAATSINLGNYGANALALTGAITWSTGSGVSRTLAVNAVTGGGTTVNVQTLGGVITSAGSGNQIIKQGIGTLAITANNAATLDWTGSQAVQIKNGTLLLGADTALGATPLSAVSDNIVIDGGVLAYSALYTLNANRGISLGASGGVIDTSTFAPTFAGTVGGTGGLIKNGSGFLTLSGASTFTGGVFVNAGTLNFTNAAAPTPSGLAVAAGATLNLTNGSGQSINLGSGTINLGAGTGAATLGLELSNPSAYDRFTTTGAALTANTVQLNLTALPGMTGGTFNLLTAASGLNSATYLISAMGLSVNSLTATAAQVQLVAAPLGDVYWKGGINLSWTATSGTYDTNFSSDLAGTNARGLPGAASGVTFSANGLTATTLSTTLDAAFSIRDLTFNNNTGSGPLTALTIAAGTGGSLRLTPTASTAGINVQSGAPASIAISAPVTLGADQTWTVTDPATVLNVSGAISGTANLTKAGSGILQLGGANTYVGTTTVANGILRAGATNALNANSAFIVGATGILRLNGFSAAVGSLSGSAGAIVDNGTATAATLTVGSDNTNTTFAGTLQNGGTATFGLTKVGTGALTLSGFSNYTGNTTVSTSAGNTSTLNIAGSLIGNTTTTIFDYGSSAGNAVVNLSGNLVAFVTRGANVATSVAVFNQTAGNVTIVPPNSSDSQYLANNSGFGMLNITGGTFNTGRFDGVGAVSTAASVAMIYVGGSGTLNQNVGDWFLPIRTNGKMSMTVAPGGTFVRSSAVTAQFSIIGLDGTNTYGIFNVAGGNADAGLSKGLSFSSGFNPGTGNVGFVNVAGGTLSLGANTIIGNATGSTVGYFNFAGGTVKANTALTAVIPGNTANYTFTSTLFGAITNNNNANAAFNTQVGATSNFTGGLTVDTNTFAVTFSNALVGATGKAVTQANIAIPSLGNSGFIAAPLVQFAAPAGGGVPAAGYALISGGQVTGIVITNPGTYAASETPLITLTGGGGSIAAFNASALTTDNGVGGLTKIGLGTLTLSGANTYAGTTLVSAGSLSLTGSLTGSNVNVNGGTASLTQASTGFIAGTGTTLTVTQGTANIAGTANTYTGATAVNGGVLTVTGAGTLGSTSGLTVAAGAQFGYQPTAAGSLNVPSFTLASGSQIVSTFIGNTASTGAAVTGGNVILAPSGAFSSGTTYNLLTASGGLSGATYEVRNPTNYTYTLGLSDTVVSIIPTTATPFATYFWKGGFTGSPAVWSVSNGLASGGLSNWASDVGGTDTPLVPGSAAAVTFSATGATNLTGMTLGANMAISNLTIGGTSPVSLNADGYTLTIAGATGILVNAGVGAVSLNSNITLGIGQTWTNNSTNPLSFGGLINNAGNLLTLSNPVNTNINISGIIDGLGGLLKSGAGTATLSGVNTYSGSTTLDAGTLAVTASSSLAGPLVFGSTNTTTTLGNLSVSAANPTFAGGLTVQTNSATGNQISVASGQTLTIGGNVVIGSGAGVNTTTKLTTAGGGTLTFNNPASTATFVVGGTSGTSGVGNVATADFSGLGTLNILLNGLGSTITINPNITTGTTNVAGKFSVVILAPTSTIDATTLNIGNGVTFTTPGTSGDTSQTNQLRLGSISNTLFINTINLGLGGRDFGKISFAGANGTLTIRDATGTGRAALNLGAGGANTQTGTTTTTGDNNVFDVSGHSVDLLLGAVVLGNSQRNAYYSNKLNFDTGTMDMTSLSMALKTGQGGTDGAAGKVVVSTVNIGGGTVAIGNGGVLMSQATTGASTNLSTETSVINITNGAVTVGYGGITMGSITATTTGHTANATLNVSGGSLNVGATLGVSITMANVTASNTTVTAISLTGGVTTLAGDIIKVGGAGDSTSTTLTLNGGTLDMSGRNIGNATAPINNVNLQSGTLQNLGQLNGGGAFTKTTSGLLTLAGTNSFTGPVNVNAGELRVTGTNAGTGAISVTAVSGTSLLSGTGTVAGPVSVGSNGTVRGDSGNGTGTLTTSSVTVNNPGSLLANLGTGTAASQLSLVASAGILDLKAGSTLQLTTVPGYTLPNSITTYTLALTSNGAANLKLDGLGQANNATFGQFTSDGAGSGTNLGGTFVQINAGSLAASMALNDQFTLSRSGDNLVLTFTPSAVPEPVTALGLAAMGLGLAGWVRRRRNAKG